jgi:hypothetical protein
MNHQTPTIALLLFLMPLQSGSCWHQMTPKAARLLCLSIYVCMCVRVCVQNNKVSLINFCTPRMPPLGAAVKIHSSGAAALLFHAPHTLELWCV